MLMDRKGDKMKHRKKLLILSAAAIVVIAMAGAGVWIYMDRAPGGQAPDESGMEEGAKEAETDIPSKTEYTEEEKALVESQTGVTVTDDGVMHVDIGSIMAEEESVNIKREEAYSLALESLGEGAEIESASIREYEETKYWVVRATKGEESWQIWLNADNGEEFINQKDV